MYRGRVNYPSEWRAFRTFIALHLFGVILFGPLPPRGDRQADGAAAAAEGGRRRWAPLSLASLSSSSLVRPRIRPSAPKWGGSFLEGPTRAGTTLRLFRGSSFEKPLHRLVVRIRRGLGRSETETAFRHCASSSTFKRCLSSVLPGLSVRPAFLRAWRGRARAVSLSRPICCSIHI